ncbi:MAG: pyrroline-5-carboxylate reductase, partial [Burkholderiaceae bacterium]|nr:pyrroline-5-carboxylate reductase [Burkholderiaceae bacterium]
MLEQHKIGFIGGGNMAQALAKGLINNGLSKSSIHIVEVNPDSLTQWHAQGISAQASPDQALTQCDIWVLAVKPQIMSEVLAQVKPYLKENTLILSIAAGIPLASLSQWLGEGAKTWPFVVRCMPNTPALIGAGAMGLTALHTVSAAQKEVAHAIMESVGHVVWVTSDNEIDAVTALSGSGPAYVFRFIEALIEGGVALGLSAEHARSLALATLSGATQLAQASDEPLAILRER